MTYEAFIKSKEHSSGNFGFDALFIPDMAFDFQKHIIEKAVKKGRIGVFADTGLGKTLIQLSIAYNIVLKTNKRVLILTPLAVAFQFLDEAVKLGIDDIDRIVELYSNPDEVVFTTFMGVGSEVYSPVSMGRKAIGVELNDSYFKQAIANMKDAEMRYAKKFTQASLF